MCFYSYFLRENFLFLHEYTLYFSSNMICLLNFLKRKSICSHYSPYSENTENNVYIHYSYRVSHFSDTVHSLQSPCIMPSSRSTVRFHSLFQLLLSKSLYYFIDSSWTHSLYFRIRLFLVLAPPSWVPPSASSHFSRSRTLSHNSEHPNYHSTSILGYILYTPYPDYI